MKTATYILPTKWRVYVDEGRKGYGSDGFTSTPTFSTLREVKQWLTINFLDGANIMDIGVDKVNDHAYMFISYRQKRG